MPVPAITLNPSTEWATNGPDKMKLLQRTSRYYLLFSLTIFLVQGIALFVISRYVLNHTVDEGLVKTSYVLHRQLPELDSLPRYLEVMDEVVEIEPIEKLTGHTRFTDTLIFDSSSDEQEMEPYRKYTYEDELNGRYYQISLNHSKVESEDLALVIFLSCLFLLLLTLLATNLLNKFLSERLWKPFHRTIDQVKNFSVQRSDPPVFSVSQTDEFEILNRSLERMTGQLINDYQSLRQFTENASHEMQTPLAIMRNQIDLLLGGDERTEADYALIQSLSEAVSRLTKLHQSLLLLTKIERQQFVESEWVDLEPLIRKKLAQLQSFLADKEIGLSLAAAPTSLRIHPVLADVLLNNLLGNAIRHNRVGGKLEVTLSDHVLIISNTGPPPKINPARLFERFRKQSTSSDSLGLGLAIVKEICDQYRYGIGYRFEEDRHIIEVRFRVEQTSVMK